MIQVVDFLADCPLVKLWNVPLSSISWWRYECKPCQTQLRLLFCADVNFVSQVEQDDKGLLVYRPVIPRPDNKYVGLDLTRLDAQKPLQVYVWNYKAYWNDASDEVIRTEIKVEVDIGV